MRLFVKLYFLSGFASMAGCLCLASCTQSQSGTSVQSFDTTEFRTNDTIPEVRKLVNKKPVASYTVPVDDPAYHYQFSVQLFETPQTFRYQVKLRYETLEELDTLRIPNFGTWPVVQLKPGNAKTSCVAGFLDKDQHFREYKLYQVKDKALQVIVLKRYFAGVYLNKK